VLYADPISLLNPLVFVSPFLLADKKVEVRRCVVGVPVHFNARQRRATQEACQMAGFREVGKCSLLFGLLVRWPILIFILHGKHVAFYPSCLLHGLDHDCELSL